MDCGSWLVHTLHQGPDFPQLAGRTPFLETQTPHLISRTGFQLDERASANPSQLAVLSLSSSTAPKCAFAFGAKKEACALVNIAPWPLPPPEWDIRLAKPEFPASPKYLGPCLHFLPLPRHCWATGSLWAPLHSVGLSAWSRVMEMESKGAFLPWNNLIRVFNPHCLGRQMFGL